MPVSSMCYLMHSETYSSCFVFLWLIICSCSDTGATMKKWGPWTLDIPSPLQCGEVCLIRPRGPSWTKPMVRSVLPSTLNWHSSAAHVPGSIDLSCSLLHTVENWYHTSIDLIHLLYWVSVSGMLPYASSGDRLCLERIEEVNLARCFVFFIIIVSQAECFITPSSWSVGHKTQLEQDCGKQKGQDYHWALILV